MDLKKVLGRKKLSKILFIIIFFIVGVMILRTVNKNDIHEEDGVKANDVKITESEASPDSTELGIVNKNDNHEDEVVKTNDIKITESEASPNSDELETVNKNDNHEEVVVKINDVKITESETNPYSRETTVGFYLNDIFEANRGSYTSKDLSQEDSFEYYEIFNPYRTIIIVWNGKSIF